MCGILPQSCNTVYLLLWDQLFAWLDYIIRRDIDVSLNHIFSPILVKKKLTMESNGKLGRHQCYLNTFAGLLHVATTSK